MVQDFFNLVYSALNPTPETLSPIRKSMDTRAIGPVLRLELGFTVGDTVFRDQAVPGPRKYVN